MLQQPATEEQTLEQQALAAITAVLRQKRRVIVAYSGGKDSTVVLLLALKAAAELRARGEAVMPILLTHGDTGVDNPMVSILVAQELRKAKRFAQQHGIDLQIEIARPLLNDTWAVSTLSGRTLPTFANTGSRSCSIMLKVNPMTRLRNKLLRAAGRDDDELPPVTLLGTRFEESDSRAARMSERGEIATAPWENNGQWLMSVIAHWDMGDVWSYLAKYRDGQMHGFTDARAIFELYASATDENTCAVVGDMATENLKKSRACGARTGCFSCTAVGRDKSLESMMSKPENAWLRPLNMIQRFLVDTRYDWSRRDWIGRTLTDGKVAITPNGYSPSMLYDLLSYCLSADADEAMRAARLGVAPGFQIVSEEQLLAIDARWSLNGIQKRPFAALDLWKRIHVHGERFYPPEIDVPAPSSKVPTRYLTVGEDWDSDSDSIVFGFIDPIMQEMGGAGCMGVRATKDGKQVLDANVAPHFSFDEEAMALFFQFEMDDVLERYHDGASDTCLAAFMYYARSGMLATTTGHVNEHIDRIMRRTQWKLRHDLVGEVDLPSLLERAVPATPRSDGPVGDTVTNTAETLLKMPQLPLWEATSLGEVAISGHELRRTGRSVRAIASKEQNSGEGQPAPQMDLWAAPALTTQPETQCQVSSWSETRARFSSLLENASLSQLLAEPNEIEEAKEIESRFVRP